MIKKVKIEELNVGDTLTVKKYLKEIRYELPISINENMAKKAGEKVTIKKINGNSIYIEEDSGSCTWTIEMFENIYIPDVIVGDTVKLCNKDKLVDIFSLIKNRDFDTLSKKYKISRRQSFSMNIAMIDFAEKEAKVVQVLNDRIIKIDIDNNIFFWNDKLYENLTYLQLNELKDKELIIYNYNNNEYILEDIENYPYNYIKKGTLVVYNLDLKLYEQKGSRKYSYRHYRHRGLISKIISDYDDGDYLTGKEDDIYACKEFFSHYLRPLNLEENLIRSNSSKIIIKNEKDIIKDYYSNKPKEYIKVNDNYFIKNDNLLDLKDKIIKLKHEIKGIKVFKCKLVEDVGIYDIDGNYFEFQDLEYVLELVLDEKLIDELNKRNDIENIMIRNNIGIVSQKELDEMKKAMDSINNGTEEISKDTIINFNKLLSIDLYTKGIKVSFHIMSIDGGEQTDELYIIDTDGNIRDEDGYCIEDNYCLATLKKNMYKIIDIIPF